MFKILDAPTKAVEVTKGILLRKKDMNYYYLL